MAGYDPEAGTADDKAFFSSGLFSIDAAVGEVPVILGYAPSTGLPGSPYAGPPKPEPGLPGSRLAGPPKPTAGRTATTAKLIEAAQGFYQLPQDQVAELQAKLYAGHFYDDSYYTRTGKKPAFGVPDEDSYGAYYRALVRAARSGQAVGDVLGAAARGSGALDAEIRQPLVIQLTSPTDLRKVYEDAATRIAGRKLSEGDLTRYISEYQDAERQAQQQVYAAGGSGLPGGPGGTVTQPAALTSSAEQAVRKAAPVEAGAHDIATQMTAFFGLLGGLTGGQ